MQPVRAARAARQPTYRGSACTATFHLPLKKSGILEGQEGLQAQGGELLQRALR